MSWNSTLSTKTPMKRTAMAKPKIGKCKVCRTTFQKRSMGHVACGMECAAIQVERDKEKKARIAAKIERQSDKARKAALMTRKDWLPIAQEAFNAFIRYRDRFQTCICCGKPFEPQKIGGSIDAGHYLSRGSACHLRFDERNVHAQRKNCNRPGGTTRAAFRDGMVKRIGEEAVEALEADQASRDWDVDALKAITALYRAKLRELKKAGE